jgi:hypothetical protein
MKIKLLSLTIIILSLSLLTNCSSDENRETKESECKILRYNKITTDVYEVQLIYLSSLLIKREHYGNTASESTGTVIYGKLSEDSIVYNSNNTVAKIVYQKNKHYDLFFYQENSKVPYMRENIKVSDNNYTTKWIENIKYDSENRIIQTVGDYENEETEVYKITTNYTYDSNGNLSQVSEINNPLDGNKTEKTINFSNFDSNKNPFRNINIPFVDYRNRAYSKNNYRAYISKSIYKGNISTDFFWETSSYQYNEFGYPLFAEYECR